MRSPRSSSNHASAMNAARSRSGSIASVASTLRSCRKLTARYSPETSCGIAHRHHPPALQQQRAVAEAVDGAHVVGDEQDRAAVLAHAVELAIALVLEGGVSDRQHLVDQQHLGVDLDHDGERQPHVHAGRVVLELHVLELAQLGEVDHRVHPPACLVRAEAEQDRVQHNVVLGGEVGVESDSELDEGRHAAVDADRALVGSVDAGQALEQRALARPVAPHDAEELSRLDGEGDVVQALQRLVAAAPEAVQRPLLEGAVALLRHPEALADVLDADRRCLRFA